MKLTEILHKVIMTSLSENLTIDVMKNMDPAPYMGSRFGQDVEPSGTYVSQGHTELNGYLNGKAHLQKPLFIDITRDTQIEYKRELAAKYKAKKKQLTNKLMKLGYDSIVTRLPDGEYGEIVLFPNASFMLH